MRYFVYKLKNDTGGAPCAYRRLLSLAICKPSIRASAQEGDWIFGFGASTTIGERLIYIAAVTEKLHAGTYYRGQRYKARPDRIYEWRRERLVWRKSSLYHEGGSARDIGHPPHYERANVLLSKNFRYFGVEGTDSYKPRFPAICALVEGLGQGHRVNHSPALASELTALQAEIWKQFPRRKQIGRPSEADLARRCDSNEGRTVTIRC